VPKRSDQKRFRGGPKVEQLPVANVRVPAPPLREGLHPFAVMFYESLEGSGQAQFYEPSDWRAAQLCAEAIDAYMERRTGAALGGVLQLFSVLGVTEGDRRRMQIELVRQSEDEQARAEAEIHDIWQNVASDSS
jgi:hypothetical protein